MGDSACWLAYTCMTCGQMLDKNSESCERCVTTSGTSIESATAEDDRDRQVARPLGVDE